MDILLVPNKHDQTLNYDLTFLCVSKIMCSNLQALLKKNLHLYQ